MEPVLKPYQPAVFRMLVEHCGLPADPFHIGQLVEQACCADAPDALQLLLERSGLPPSNVQLLKAVEAASLGCVQALLAAAGGPLHAPPPDGLSLAPSAQPWRAEYQCPVLAVLLQNLNPEHAANSRKLLLIMEALQAAGYRPTVYENVQVRRGSTQPQLVARFDPLAEDPAFDLQGANRFMWLALDRPEWAPEQHRRFPPHFKRAVQTLLLAVHRGRGAESGGGTAGDDDDGSSGSALLQHMAALPNDLLLRIVGHAAYPLSAWVPVAQE